MKRILLLAALLLVAIPTTSATVDVSAPGGDLELMTGMTETISVTIKVSCDEFVMAGAQTLTYTLGSNAPTAWGASYDDVTLTAGAGCVPGNEISATGDIKLSPGADAVALMSQTLKIYAINGATNLTFDRPGNVYVAYDPGHTLTPSIAFPFEWTGGDMLSFNLTIDITANDDTMVMFFPVSSAANGTVSGLGNQKFFFRQGEEGTRTMPVTWTPPAGNWDNATITFEHYSHCLNGGALDACDAQLEETTVWTIQNMAPPTTSEGDKDTPGVGAGLLIGLLAVALVLRRR